MARQNAEGRAKRSRTARFTQAVGKGLKWVGKAIYNILDITLELFRWV